MAKTKKHWIMVKRGLSADPKHREAMGQAIWCFLHIIDRADYETGKVFDWRDGDEAEDMAVNERTLRSWRQALEKAGYISCKQRQRGIDITIFNWINPRDYSSGVINPKGDIETAPSEIEGDIETAPSEFQGDMQGDIRVDIQGDIRVRRENVTPTLDSGIKSQESDTNGGGENLAWLSRKYTSLIGVIPNMQIADSLKDYSTLPLPWLEYAFEQLKACKEPVRNKWSYVKAVLETCRENNGIPTPASKVTGKAAAALQFLQGVS